MKIPFKTNFTEGDENVMTVGEINPDEIRFNRVTREISIVYVEPKKEKAKVRKVPKAKFKSKVKK